MCKDSPCKDYTGQKPWGIPEQPQTGSTTNTNTINTFIVDPLPAFSDLCMRLARAHARGHKQLALVNEMLTGSSVKAHNFKIPGTRRETLKYGEARVDYQSWQSLKLRLLTAGFYFVVVEEDTFIMKFSG